MKTDTRIRISTFTYQRQDFDVLLNKDKISYIFEIGNNRYGNAVTIKSRSRQDVVDAVFNLLINFMETYAKAKGR